MLNPAASTTLIDDIRPRPQQPSNLLPPNFPPLSKARSSRALTPHVPGQGSTPYGERMNSIATHAACSCYGICATNDGMFLR
jgi:hypothetical protein